jgi:CheY-like chemotaxis protein/HPt (histidine-containing phosphotransfer) domain-containing protein
MLTSGPWLRPDEENEIAAVLTKPIKASQLYDALVQIFAEERHAPPELDMAPGSKFDAEMAHRLPLRILVAEDNAVNQQVALSFLGRLGYRADVAANGLEVLSSLERQPYDVVLMDVQMPEMDGLEATRRIRDLPPVALSAGVQPRIIAMTANAMREDYDICLAAGMDDYVSKPVQVEELVEALNRCGPHQADGQQRPAFAEASGPGRRGAVPPAEVLDPGALKRMRETLGQRADSMLPELVEGFYEDAERLLDQARQALKQGYADELRIAAHSLKSTSATFGAMALTEVARDLEHLAQAGTLDAANEQIARAEAEFDRAKAALEALPAIP